jgi:branched-chain amino acid transport system substrate-binding protein
MAKSLLRIVMVVGVVALLTTAGFAGAARQTALKKVPPAIPVDIGAVCDLSGPSAPFGQACNDGMRLAVQQIATAGGFYIGKKRYTLRLTMLDGRSDASTSIADVSELVNDKHIKFLFGPDLSNTALQMAGATKGMDNVIHISAGSATQSVLGTPGYENLFGVVSANAQWISSVIPLLKALGIKPGSKIGIAYPQDATGTSVPPIITSILQPKGYTATTYLFAPTTSDFTSLVTKMKADGMDALIVGNSTIQDLPFARAVAQLGAAKALIGVGGTPSDIALQIAKERGSAFPIPYGYLTSQPNMGQPTTKGLKAFKSLLVSRTNEDPNSIYATQVLPWWLEPTRMLVKSMQNAGTVTNVLAIRTALAKLHYNFYIQDYHFDSKHIAVYGTDYATVINGKVQYTYVPPSS